MSLNDGINLQRKDLCDAIVATYVTFKT